MKLNFWQVLGIILIVVYLILWFSGVVGKNKESGEPRSPHTTGCFGDPTPGNRTL
ncbi:MAG: hypothetical protein KatS3mg104_3200 [Phycisphaerae bacterium]|nr:MAG: hypothetical protein KatS3mg104_3200 [Phycisphaerae bacterium]